MVVVVGLGVVVVVVVVVVLVVVVAGVVVVMNVGFKTRSFSGNTSLILGSFFDFSEGCFLSKRHKFTDSTDILLLSKFKRLFLRSRLRCLSHS